MPPAIGRYQVSRLLGEGAMGRVYLATDPELGRQVAIKVLRLDAAGNARDAYIARFRNEARAAARLQHPNVVTLHDTGVDSVLGPYLVYEYVAGQTLRARINEGKLDPRAVVALARGVGAALDAMHAAGIIHRDVKPDNILIAPDGAVKVTDFGIARVSDVQLTRDGQFLGTPAYASPEAITRGVYTARGDQFSLAAVLYESLCGIRPFPGDDAVAVSYAVANDVPPPPSKWVKDLPPLVDQCFERALSKKANDRFLLSGEFAATLAAAFRGSAQVSAVATAPLVRRPQHAGAVPVAVEGDKPKAPAQEIKPTPPSVAAKLSPSSIAIVAVVLVAAVALAFVRWKDGSDSDPRDRASHRASTQPSVNTNTTPAAATQTPATAPVRGRARGTRPR
ncbi:MAG: serine/threonine protein kinase [Myxococcales bacterium]|nr:serine/threonine protein kinase [Myxococcales bacterium]